MSPATGRRRRSSTPRASNGCDLIFMASHGARGRLGMAFASETLSVLMNAGLPVLVTSIGEPAAAARAIGIIRDEHRSLAAVMHAWLHALAAARDEGTAVDPVLMPAIVRYLKQFPLKLHHPEGARAPVPAPARAHVELQRRARRARAPARARSPGRRARSSSRSRPWPMVRAEGRSRAIRALEDEVARYATFLWRPLRPRGRRDPAGGAAPPAGRRLDGDRRRVHREPRPDFRGDTDKEYRHLFSRIVNLGA